MSSPEDARSWAGDELVESWLGDSMYDVQLRAGEEVTIPLGDAAALAATRRFRDVLGRFASGVTVVTALIDDVPVGLTCQSFSSVSLTPPLVLFVPSRSSRAWPRIERAGRFCVNFLADGQGELSNRMASKGAEKFAGVGWTPAAVTGAPVLDGTLGHVDCVLHAVHDGGDHWVVLGRVVDLQVGDPARPLLFFEGRYRTTDA